MLAGPLGAEEKTMLLRSVSPIFISSLEDYRQISQNYFRRQLYNPFTCSFDKEKEQCMLDNDVIIVSDISEMKKLVFSKLWNDFVKEHILRDIYE